MAIVTIVVVLMLIGAFGFSFGKEKNRVPFDTMVVITLILLLTKVL